MESWSQLHSQTIIYINIDCFYAQVELLQKPHLQNEPVVVKQKNLVATCNYAAKEYGVKKCMLISEALKICPNLLIFNGEDVYKYQQVSNEIYLFLLTYTNKVEKSGLGENYIDVSELVNEKRSSSKYFDYLRGHCIGNVSDDCACGCHKRLSTGSQIAYEIRRKLKTNLGLISSCGISFNKFLARESCSAHEPNQQTVLLPNGSVEFLLKLKQIENLISVGGKIKHTLECMNDETVKDLQEVDFKYLKRNFQSGETAVTLKNHSLGIWDQEVKQSNESNSVSVDNFQKILLEYGVKEKFKTLLQRLMILAKEGGRIPIAIKVTVRKHDKERKIGNKETKQSPVPTALFGCPLGNLSEESTNKLLNIIMGLFCKMVNVSKPFHITLLGLAFSKFHEKINNLSITSFLLKKQHLSVQSLTSFVFNETITDVTDTTVSSITKLESDSDAEPSPKKTKLDVATRKASLSKDIEMYSPSKLKVENLNINGDLDLPKEYPAKVNSNVFQQLTQDLQEEIIMECRMTCANTWPKCRKNQNLIHVHYIPENNI